MASKTEQSSATYSEIQSILGEQSEYLLGHNCETVSKYDIHLPSPDFVDRIFSVSDS